MMLLPNTQPSSLQVVNSSHEDYKAEKRVFENDNVDACRLVFYRVGHWVVCGRPVRT